jgi:excisionase family DNA binding protein
VLPPHLRDRVTLRPREVAQITGLSVKTVHDLVNEGVLRRMKIRGAVLIPVEDVKRMLSEAAGGHPEPRLTPRGVAAVRSLRERLKIGGER